MKAHAVFRLGRDVQLNRTNSGDTVANLALATNVRKGQDELTVWVDAALFGKRADALAPFLTKGKQVMVDLDGLHLETYQGNNGPVTKLVARVLDITMLGKRDDGGGAPQQEPRQQAPQAPAPRQPAPPRAAAGFDDLDEDIPF